MPVGWGLANRLVFKKVREALGLENVKILAIGAAPTRLEVQQLHTMVLPTLVSGGRGPTTTKKIFTTSQP